MKFFLPLAALVLLPGLASAQDGFLFHRPNVAFSFRLGVAQPQASGDLFGMLTRELTLNSGDFRTGSVAGEIALAVAPRIDVVLGVAGDRSENRSEYRNLVDQNDKPIEQSTSLRRTSVTASAKYYLTPRGRSIAKHAWIPASLTPYVEAGGGIVSYRLGQSGDWVDVNTNNIFTRSFYSSGSGGTAHAGGGAEWWLNPHLALQADGRYAWGTASVSDVFTEFRKIDLRGFQVTTGLSVRF